MCRRIRIISLSMLVSDGSIRGQVENDGWNGFNYYAFVRLDPRAKSASIDDKLTALSKKYLGDETSLFFTLYPVTDIHLKSDYTYEAEAPGSERAVVFLRIISLFILLIAWVNYVNLSTARAVNRAKEVGLRKVVGAVKGQLIGQFLLEALLVNLVAALSGPASFRTVATLLQPTGGQSDHFARLEPPAISARLADFLSARYVRFRILSGPGAVRFPAAVAVLKGKFRNSRSGTRLRKGLVVVQFAASVILIAATFIVFRQVQFMQGKDLGIDVDYVMGFRMPSVENEQREANQIKN